MPTTRYNSTEWSWGKTRNNAMGQAGEEFFKKHPNYLVGDEYYIYKLFDTRDQRLEGADYYIHVVKHEQSDIFLGSEWARPLLEVSENATQVTPKYYEGGVEIKTKDVYNSIARTNLMRWECGSVDFPLYDEYRDGSIHPGFLQRLFHPSWKNEEKTLPSSVEPLAYVLVYVFEKEAGVITTDNFSPFEVIAFTKFKELRKRLIELYGNKLDFMNWDSISKNREKLRELRDDGILIQNYMLQVPFERVADLATVTIVGEKPQFIQNGRTCPIILQEKRWQYQVDCAAGRHIDIETPPEELKTEENKRISDFRKQLVARGLYKKTILNGDGYLE